MLAEHMQLEDLDMMDEWADMEIDTGLDTEPVRMMGIN